MIVAYLGICRQTLVLWIAGYRKSGIEGILLSVTRAKKSKIITPEIHEGLSEKLKDTKHSLRGYWDAQQCVLSHYGVDIKGSSEFPMGKSQTMLKNVAQVYFFMEIFK